MIILLISERACADEASRISRGRDKKVDCGRKNMVWDVLCDAHVKAKR